MIKCAYRRFWLCRLRIPRRSTWGRPWPALPARAVRNGTLGEARPARYASPRPADGRSPHLLQLADVGVRRSARWRSSGKGPLTGGMKELSNRSRFARGESKSQDPHLPNSGRCGAPSRREHGCGPPARRLIMPSTGSAAAIPYAQHQQGHQRHYGVGRRKNQLRRRNRAPILG